MAISSICFVVVVVATFCLHGQVQGADMSTMDKQLESCKTGPNLRTRAKCRTFAQAFACNRDSCPNKCFANSVLGVQKELRVEDLRKYVTSILDNQTPEKVNQILDKAEKLCFPDLAKAKVALDICSSYEQVTKFVECVSSEGLPA